MNAKENGRLAAFPAIEAPYANGLTKREAMAMAADIPWDDVDSTMRAQNVKPKGTDGNFTLEQFLAARAKMMVIQADALLAELAKEQS